MVWKFKDVMQMLSGYARSSSSVSSALNDSVGAFTRHSYVGKIHKDS